MLLPDDGFPTRPMRGSRGILWQQHQDREGDQVSRSYGRNINPVSIIKWRSEFFPLRRLLLIKSCNNISRLGCCRISNQIRKPVSGASPQLLSPAKMIVDSSPYLVSFFITASIHLVWPSISYIIHRQFYLLVSSQSSVASSLFKLHIFALILLVSSLSFKTASAGSSPRF